MARKKKMELDIINHNAAGIDIGSSHTMLLWGNRWRM